jgi:hypothetical protein
MAGYKTKKAHSSKKEPKTLKGRKKAKKVKASATVNSGPNMKYDQIDVTKLEQVSKLVEHIKNNIVTLVLIYADWCGHCGVFKNGMWKKLAGMKNRKMAMAMINETVLKDTPFADLKIDGYPTTTLVGSDMKAATIKKENGEHSNALPDHNNEEKMSSLVTMDPKEISREYTLSTSPSPPSDSREDVSATPTPEAEQARLASAETILNDYKTKGKILNNEDTSIVPNPPDTDEDLLSSQVKDGTIDELRTKEDSREDTGETKSSATVGGGAKTRRAPKGSGTLKKMRGRGKK